MTTEEKTIGRNEPCPCGSGKKYKRCCGVDAAPKLSTPAQASPDGGTADAHPFAGFDPNSIDPKFLNQFAQMFKKLPKGQMQKFQALMQKAASGKDISKEAAQLQGSLPVEFQQMLNMAPDPTQANPDTGTPSGEPTKKFGAFWRNLLKKG